MDVFLIYLDWIKNLQTSTLVFDIAQFFPLFNYQLLSLILDKAGFNSKISSFFSDYLISKKTQYLGNNFVFSLFNVNIGIGQNSTLFPILSALYILLIFHIFKKRSKKFNIPVLFLFFVTIDFSFHKKNILKKQIVFLFITIISFCLYSNILDLSLNMENLKFFIFQISQYF